MSDQNTNQNSHLISVTLHFDKLVFVLKSLRELHTIAGTGLTGLTIKNIRVAETKLVEVDKELALLDEKFIIKDGEKPAKFSMKVLEGGGMSYATDESGKFITLSDEESKSRPSAHKVNDMDDEYLKTKKELKESVTCEFYKYPNDKMNALISKGMFDKVEISVLDGILFEIKPELYV